MADVLEQPGLFEPPPPPPPSGAVPRSRSRHTVRVQEG